MGLDIQVFTNLVKTTKKVANKILEGEEGTDKEGRHVVWIDNEHHFGPSFLSPFKQGPYLGECESSLFNKSGRIGPYSYFYRWRQWIKTFLKRLQEVANDNLPDPSVSNIIEYYHSMPIKPKNAD